MAAWVSITHQTFGACVEVLLAHLGALAEGGGYGLIEDLDAVTWSNGDFDAIQAGAVLASTWTDGPHLARR